MQKWKTAVATIGLGAVLIAGFALLVTSDNDAPTPEETVRETPAPPTDTQTELVDETRTPTPPPVAEPPPERRVAQDQRIVIKGSNTLGAKMVPSLMEEFEVELRRFGVAVSPEIAAEGSGTGINAMLDNEADIAMSSRHISDGEVVKANERGIRVREVAVAYDSIAIVVNEDSPIDNLTAKQVEELFTGNIRDWGQLRVRGLRPGPVSVYTRDSASGTFKEFQDMALRGQDYGGNRQEMKGNEQIAEEVSNNRRGVGYVGLAFIEKSGLKVVAVDGMLPNDPDYPIRRPLFYYIPNEPSDMTNLFIGFTLSPKGQAIVRKSGFLPLY
ncbi:MAG: phosphate ABC transporter substrate-binding protein [Opitutales bacterium]